MTAVEARNLLDKFKKKAEEIFDEELAQVGKNGRTLDGAVARSAGRINRLKLEDLA